MKERRLNSPNHHHVPGLVPSAVSTGDDVVASFSTTGGSQYGCASPTQLGCCDVSFAAVDNKTRVHSRNRPQDRMNLHACMQCYKCVFHVYTKKKPSSSSSPSLKAQRAPDYAPFSFPPSNSLNHATLLPPTSVSSCKDFLKNFLVLIIPLRSSCTKNPPRRE
jgi:hypothetical protein